MTSDTDDAMSRYFELVKAEPGLFRNVAGGIEILVDPVSIASARDVARAQRSRAG